MGTSLTVQYYTPLSTLLSESERRRITIQGYYTEIYYVKVTSVLSKNFISEVIYNTVLTVHGDGKG